VLWVAVRVGRGRYCRVNFLGLGRRRGKAVWRVWALLEWIEMGLGFALEFKSRVMVDRRLGGSLVYDTPVQTLWC
jgi:hypothetical protein